MEEKTLTYINQYDISGKKDGYWEYTEYIDDEPYIWSKGYYENGLKEGEWFFFEFNELEVVGYFHKGNKVGKWVWEKYGYEETYFGNSTKSVYVDKNKDNYLLHYIIGVDNELYDDSKTIHEEENG